MVTALVHTSANSFVLEISLLSQWVSNITRKPYMGRRGAGGENSILFQL